MTRFSVLASMLLAMSLGFPGSAAAQVVIDGVAVSPQDVPRVRSYCNSLLAATRSSLTEDSGAELLDPSPDPASSFSQGASSMDNALSRFNLNRLTAAKCRAAGFR
jgi:hypothetical protein